MQQDGEALVPSLGQSHPETSWPRPQPAVEPLSGVTVLSRFKLLLEGRWQVLG